MPPPRPSLPRAAATCGAGPSLIALVLVLLVCGSADAGTRVEMACRRNLRDGRALPLHDDGTLRGVRAPLVGFEASTLPRPVKDGWLYGTCAFEVPR